MSCDLFSLATSGVSGLTPYRPGKSIEQLQREMNLDEVVKLASNENPSGCSPKSITRVNDVLLECNRYPDSSGFVASGQYSCSPCRTSHLEDGT